MKLFHLSYFTYRITHSLSPFEAVNRMIYLRKPISCQCVYLNSAI